MIYVKKQNLLYHFGDKLIFYIIFYISSFNQNKILKKTNIKGALRTDGILSCGSFISTCDMQFPVFSFLLAGFSCTSVVPLYSGQK